MAQHKDALKRIRQNEKRRTRNRHYRTRMRNQIKVLRQAVADGDATRANAELASTVSIIQRVASKGIIHPNQAARKVKRLHQAVKALAS